MPAIQIPHNFKPRPYQLPFLRAMDAGFKRAVIVWHRRSGKDKTALQVVIKNMLKRVGTYFYIFPTYNQGRKALWDGLDKDGFALMKHFPAELIAKRNEAEMRIELKNGSAFQIIGGDSIDNVVGTNPIGVVYSEYPVGQQRAWDLVRPILLENGGFAIFCFTPRGMNHGFKILQQAKDSENWFYQVLTVADTNVMPFDELQEELKDMPRDLFEQEYYCKFIEGAGQFFRGFERCIYDDKYEPEPFKRFGVMPGKTFRLGVDLAKYHDYTVITPFDLNTFKVGLQERFNQMDYSLQKSKIETQHFKYNKALARIDSTGVGEPVYEDLNKSIGAEPYHFTEQSRRDLLTNLQLLLEQETIKIPNDPILLDELRSFRYELSDSGKVRIVVPDGLHDDMVMSLALAVWDIPSKPLPFKSADERLTIRQFDYYKQGMAKKQLTGSAYLRDKYKPPV